ncbi:hypothetical protein BsWGS_28697 [Bradybaena similaris]
MLVEYSRLPESIVENIIQYAKVVVNPEREIIDEFAFNSQMTTQFDFSNLYIICRMMRVLKSKQYQKYLSEKGSIENELSVEEFCLCVCTFLTQNQDTQINWVFAVYDSDGDGALSRRDLYTFLRPCILHAEDMDFDGETKDLVEIVMAIVDRDQNGEVDLEEFRFLVKKNVLYIDLLGQCLPSDSAMNRFRAKIENKTNAQVLELFRKEFVPKDEQLTKRRGSLYPIDLDFP